MPNRRSPLRIHVAKGTLLIVVAMFAIVATVLAAVTPELSPAGGLTFSDEVGGTSSASQPVTLRNSGDETLNGIAVSAADASRFPVVSHCGSSLGPSESCTIDVSFDAAARGSVNSTLSVTSNGAPQSILLSGTGTAPSASVAPSSLGFSATAGTSSVSQTVTMTNNGDAPLMIANVALGGANPGRFSIANRCTSPVPAGGGQCTVDVTFNPTAAGESTATLIFTDNHQGTPNSTQTVQLSGTATAASAPAVALAPTSLSFNTPAGATSVPQTVTLRNSGDATLSISGMALAGANPTRFGTTGGCPATLAPGAQCTVGVTFSPTTTGTQTATLTFTDNAPGSPHTVALSGAGTPPPVASTVAPAPPPPPPPPPPPQLVLPPPPPPPAGAQTDRDNDGVPDASDSCAATAGNLRNGCPSELNADIRGSWRVNTLLSQLLSLTVRTSVGSRIEILCSGKKRKRVCGFRTKVIKRTTRRTTNLTSYFKGRRILPTGTVIVVRVTRPLQIGTYERLQTRRGRKLPKVMNKCLSAGTAKVRTCADD